jgi:hypothetical protein
MLAKALAKMGHYDNQIFTLLFSELKHIMMFNSNNQAFSKSALGGGKGLKTLRNELAHLNIYLKYDTHKHKTFEQSGYKAILEQYEREFKFDQKRIILRHNLHNKIAKELRNRKIHY